VQLCHDPGQVKVNGFALRWSQCGQQGFGEKSTLYHFHHVELGANDAGVVAQAVHDRNRYIGILQRFHDPIFPIHLVRRWQQLTRRLFAQHISAVGGLQQEGRIGLATLKLADLQGTLVVGNVCCHIPGQYGFIELVGLAHRGQLDVTHQCLLVI
jgi:hypothetical protein